MAESGSVTNPSCICCIALIASLELSQCHVVAKILYASSSTTWWYQLVISQEVVLVFTPESPGVHPGRGPLPAFTRDTVSCHLRGFSAGRCLAAPAECWRRHLAGETGHLRSFSPARCRLQPVCQAPPRGEGDSFWQPAVPPVMAGQRPTVHRSERRWAHFCSERCIEGCLTDALWDLQDWSTAVTVWQICPNCFAVLTIYIFVWWYDTWYCILSRQSKNDVSAAWCAHGNC